MHADELPNKLPAPARRALEHAGYRRLEQFTRVSEGQLKQLHGVGPKAMRMIRDALQANGLSFGDK